MFLRRDPRKTRIIPEKVRVKNNYISLALMGELERNRMLYHLSKEVLKLERVFIVRVGRLFRLGIVRWPLVFKSFVVCRSSNVSFVRSGAIHVQKKKKSGHFFDRMSRLVYDLIRFTFASTRLYLTLRRSDASQRPQHTTPSSHTHTQTGVRPCRLPRRFSTPPALLA